MAIKIEYQPAAALLGGVANQAGQGFFQQRQEDRAQTQKNMLLNAQLQDRSRMIDFAMNQQQFQQQQMADMQRMNYAAQMQQQQQQFAAGLAVHQQQNELAFRQAAGAQELALKGMIAFSELDQNERMMQLRNSSQAKAAFEQMNAERQMLQENFDNGYLNQDQFNAMMLEQSKKIAGFRPSDYPLDGPFPPNQGMGDIWDQPVTMPDGSTQSLPHTRNRNGVPEPTYAAQKFIDSKNAIWEEQERKRLGLGSGKGANTPDAKPLMTFNDYIKAKNDLREGMQRVVPGPPGLDGKPTETYQDADPMEVDAAFNREMQQWHQAFGVRAEQQQEQMMNFNQQQSMPQGETFQGGIPSGGQPQMPVPQQAPQPTQRPMPQAPQSPDDLLAPAAKILAEHFRSVSGSYPPVAGPELIQAYAKRGNLIPRSSVSPLMGYLQMKYGNNFSLDLAEKDPLDGAIVKLLKIADRQYKKAS